MWTYNTLPVPEIDHMPEGTYGFIYEVKHIPTGKRYIGKKVLYFERNKKLGKRELEELKAERKAAGVGGRVPTKKKVITESDWKTYFGSQTEIKELVQKGKTEDFQRTILEYVPNRKLLTYYECKYLFIKEVLEDTNDYINDNILGKF